LKAQICWVFFLEIKKNIDDEFGGFLTVSKTAIIAQQE